MLQVEQYDQKPIGNASEAQAFNTGNVGDVQVYLAEDVNEVAANTARARLMHRGKVLMALFSSTVAIAYVCAHYLWATHLAIYTVLGDKMVSPELALRTANRYDAIARVIWCIGCFFVGTLGYSIIKIRQLRLAAIMSLIGLVIMPGILGKLTQIVMDYIGFEQTIRLETLILNVGLTGMVFVTVCYAHWLIKSISLIKSQGGKQ